MISENLRSALTTSKDITISLLGKVLFQSRVEPIGDADRITGVKAQWVSKQSDNSVNISSSSGSAGIKIEGSTAPTIEYVQEDEKRTIAVKHIESISCELERETLDRIASPKGAGIAMGVGAGIGLLSWFLIAVMRSLLVPRATQTQQEIPQIASEEASAQPAEPTK